MGVLKMMGNFLHNSGWSTLNEESGKATSGTADYFLHVSSVTKTRAGHQITVCALYKLMKSAFDTDIEMSGEDIGFEQWTHLSFCSLF